MVGTLGAVAAIDRTTGSATMNALTPALGRLGWFRGDDPDGQGRLRLPRPPGPGDRLP
jgi:hypothetical protein